MRVLVACECSGVVRDAFLAAGHDAISCDLKPTRVPGPHLHCDVRDVLDQAWDLMIAHPVCKYLTNAGVRWLHSDPERWDHMRRGAAFFKMLDSGKEVQHIPKRAVENPIMHEYAAEIVGRRADQFVHPWWFGSPFQKATGLHLTGLEPLKREREKNSYAPGEIKQAVWLMGPTKDPAEREEKRSITDPQIARAMVEQWGALHEFSMEGHAAEAAE